jgi:hypothetical protein
MEHQKQGVRIGFESLPLLNYRRNLGNYRGAAFLASDDAQWLSGLAIPVGGGGDGWQLASQSGVSSHLCQ